jgi:hypothetical protein
VLVALEEGEVLDEDGRRVPIKQLLKFGPIKNIVCSNKILENFIIFDAFNIQFHTFR